MARFAQPGLVDEDWKYEDGAVCDPERIKKKSYAMKVTARLPQILKGQMCFGPKGVKRKAGLGDNLLSLRLSIGSAIKMIIDGNEFNILGRENDRAVVKPGSEYAIKNPTDGNQILDFILYSGPFEKRNPEESSDESTLAESASEFWPEETGATEFTDATGFTEAEKSTVIESDATGATTRVDDEESDASS